MSDNTGGGTTPNASRTPAPMLGVLRPSVYRFKLGGFEITNILDGYVQLPSLHPTYGNDQPAEAVAALARANGLPPDRFENPYVCTLVHTGRELVLFDTGNGKGRVPTAGNLRDLLPTAGYQPEQVDVVVITHGHPDHIGGLLHEGQPAYPNARYVFGEVEFDFWKKGQNVRDARKANREQFVQVGVPLAAQSTFLKPGGEVVAGIRAVDASGHSPGMLAYHVESDGQRLLAWADVANHYVMAVQQPEWHVGFDDIKEAAVATRKRIFDMVATDRIAVSGFHMPFPSVGFLERAAGGYRWVPASYQFNL